MDTQQKCAEAYAKHKNLRVVADELGMPWQSVYVHLRKAGVAVTGDKARYGSDKDRLAAKAEQEFQRLVPFAVNQNSLTYQAKMDFMVNGFSVDVKASKLNKAYSHSEARRWAFSMKRQETVADFIVCFGFSDEGYVVFLIPGELIRKYQSLSITPRGGGKWASFKVAPNELSAFFMSLADGTREEP